MKNAACITGIVLFFSVADATAQTSVADDAPQVKGRKAVSCYPVSQKDMMWSKRVWRTIDMREKFNHPLYYPEVPAQGRTSLFDAIKSGMLSGEINGYDVADNGVPFSVQMSKMQIDRMFKSQTPVSVRGNEELSLYNQQYSETSVLSSEITAWWIMEDWFFDRARSVMDVRIVGMCPLREHKDRTGNVIGYKPMFWLHFAQLRPVLARFTCYNVKNDASVLSYDDVLQKRMFSSYIHKESNMYESGMPVIELPGLEAQYESDRIRSELATMEHDFWNY